MSSALPPSGGGAGDNNKNNNDDDGKKNNNDNKSNGKSNGNSNDDETEKNKAASSASALGTKIRRRRPRAGGAASSDVDQEEESKAEIESLAAASGFGTDNRTARNHNHHHQAIAHCQSRPGAYAVDGPDHTSTGNQSQSSLFGDGRRLSDASGDVVLGLGGASDANPNGIMGIVSSSTSTGRRSNANSTSRRRGSTRSVQSGQSGQSEDSAVVEVRAALDAEARAARASGMGTRRPSLRSSMTSGNMEDPSGIGTSSSSHRRRASSITTMSMSAAGATGAGTGGTSHNNTGSGDLANHPDIEFLAEATLVVDSIHGDDQDDDGGGGDQDEGDQGRGKDPPPDYEDIANDEDGDDGDVSTLGPPVELSSSSASQNRQRRSSAGTSSARGGGRQRRSARPTDPYADVLEATCTSVDETNHRGQSRTGTQSRPLSSSSQVIDGGGQETSPLDIEEGEGASQPADSDILVAEPLMDKCLLPRRTVVIGLAVGFVLMLAVALGVAIPMSKRKDGSTTPSPPDGGGENATYPAYEFNPTNSEILTTVPEPICFSLLPIMTNVSKICTDPAVELPKGGPMDQLIADGLLSASDPAAKIDIALINGGAFRSDIFAGDLTAGFVRKKVMPFTNNRVAYLSVTPAEIYETLNGALFDTGFVISEEQQAQFFPESPTVKLTWPYESTYPYAAGLRYDVDLNAPEGQKATNVRIHSSSSYGKKGGSGVMASEGGVEDGWIFLDPADDTTLIRVLSSDYLAGGGDGFFQTVPEDRIEILDALGITQLFMYYCSLQPELLGPDYIDGMSTRNFVPLNGYESDL